MKPFTFILAIFCFCLNWHSAISAQIYVTPIPQGCAGSCAGTLVQPFDNLIFALLAAQSLTAPQIIILNSNIADHYVLAGEKSTSSQSMLYNFTDVVMPNFTTLTIKPLFCDEMTGLTLPTNTFCTNRTEKVTLYMKTLRLSIGVTVNFTLQNILFNGIEAISDYNSGYYRNMSECTYQRKRCCPSTNFVGTFNNSGSSSSAMIQSRYLDYNEGIYTALPLNASLTNPLADNILMNQYRCNPSFARNDQPLQEGFFRIYSPVAPVDQENQQISFVNTDLQNFWGKDVRSFVQVRNSSVFTLTFNNCTIDDIFFKRGLTYVDPYSNADTLFPYQGSGSYKYVVPDNEKFEARYFSQIIVNNVKFSNYNRWPRYNSNISEYFHINRDIDSNFYFSEGYFLLVTKLMGSIEITNSTFQDTNSLSQRMCVYFPLYPVYSVLYGTANPRQKRDTDTTSMTNLYDMSYDDVQDVYVSSLVYIQTFNGRLTVEGSNFERIKSLKGSVIRIDNYKTYVPIIRSNVTIQDSVFQSNAALYSYANILIKIKTSDRSVPYPIVNITNSQFLNSTGCPGSYGNVGLLCIRPNFSPYTENSMNYLDLSQITIRDSVFKNNLLGLSNSLAIIGTLATYLENNIFQDNGGAVGEELIQYNLGLSHIPRDPMDSGAGPSYFGQSTAVYISLCFLLRVNKTTFQGNWSPFQGSQALGSSLTLLNISNDIVFEDSQFTEHNGVPLIIDPDVRDDLNCYSPSIITVDNTFGAAYFLDPTLKPILRRVDFINNNANYSSFLNTCSYIYNTFGLPKPLVYLIENNLRFRSGFLKFLTPSEVADTFSVQNTLDSSSVGGNILFSDGKIANNTLSSGCMFSNARLKTFVLSNIKIEGNQINLAVEGKRDTTVQAKGSTDNIEVTRSAIFCGYQKSAMSVLQTLLFNANGLKAKNNIGPIFNLLPDEQNYLSLTNSLFINNTCEGTSTIISLEDSQVYSSNNIFIDNTNAYGIVFTTASSFYSSALTSYLRNDGRHATLIYAKNHATAWQASSKVYWNKVSPAAYLFAKTNILQGGLYYLSSSELIIQNASFIENQAYGGLVISTTSSVSFNVTQFINHSISGTGLIGNFGSGSSLAISLTNLTNNSITDNPLSSLQPSLMTVTASSFELTDIIISNSSESNLGAILTGIQADGVLTNIEISNFEMLNETGLFSLISSNITITNLQADNITSLFGLYNTDLDLSSISIARLHMNTGSLFLMNTIASTLKISKLAYTGGSDEGSYLSLIVGFSNKIVMSEASFFNAVNGENNKIFDLKENSLFSIVHSTFTHTGSDALPTVFAFESGQTVRIEQCVFTHTGQLVQDENTVDGLYFVSNTIFASPYIQKIAVTGDNKIYILSNQFLMSEDARTTSSKDLSSSQINIVDSSGLTQLHNNVFLSLCGSVGIVQIQAKNTPYLVESVENIFINNTGTLGGALHLDASFSPNEANNASNASIDSSVFLLNRVSKVGDSTGKGGALYQTTPTLIVQNTSISNSTFIQNTAEITGGAIYFDYMPPNTDANSEFWNNSANNYPNHIGSYPVKLVYYTQEPNISRSVALPSDSPSRIYAADELYHWGNVSSGLASTENCTFILLDMFDQLIETDNSSVLEVYPSGLSTEQRYTFSNKLSVTAVNGSYTFNDFTFTYKTNGTINVMFASSAIESSRQIPLEPSSLPVIDDITIEVHFRTCGKGEYVVSNGDTKSCRACQPGFWQPGSTPDATSCKACDSASTICLGGTRVGVKQDYWRLNDTSDIVNQCPVTGACLGEEGEESRMLQEQCAYGYRSNLCAKCITGWAKTTSGACVDCQTDVWYYVRVLLVLLFQLAMIINAIRGTIVISKESDDSQKLKLNNAVLIRILTNYLQLISLVTSIPVTWPNDIKSIFSTSTQVLSITGNVFTLDCLFWSDDVSGIKVVYLKTLMNTVGPFGLIIVGILANILYFKIKRTRILRNKAFMNRSVAIAIVICFMAQTSAIQSAFALFRCENLYRTDDPVYYLVKDFEVQCWEGTHLYWALGFGLPMLILWAVVLPSLIYNALRKKKNALKSEGNLQKYSFLYGGYNDKKYYWELVVMIRKFLLIGVLIAASFQSPNLQIYFSILLIIFWYVLQYIAHPYADPNLNKLEQLSLIGAGIVSFCQLYFKFISSIPVLGTIVLVWCFIGNIIFFLYFISLYFAFQIEQLRHSRAVAGTMKKFKCLNSARLDRMITRVSTLMERLGLSQKRTSEPRTEKTEEKDIDLKTRPLDTHCFSPLAMLSARTKSFEKITSREPEENLPYEEQPSLSSPDEEAPDEDAPSLPQSLKQIELEEPQDKSMIAEKVTLGPDLGIKLIGQKKKCLTMVKGFQEPSEDVLKNL